MATNPYKFRSFRTNETVFVIPDHTAEWIDIMLGTTDPEQLEEVRQSVKAMFNDTPLVPVARNAPISQLFHGSRYLGYYGTALEVAAFDNHNATNPQWVVLAGLTTRKVSYTAFHPIRRLA